jgi:hypothetical protein
MAQRCAAVMKAAPECASLPIVGRRIRESTMTLKKTRALRKYEGDHTVIAVDDVEPGV